MGEVTEKTQWNAKVEAHRLHAAIVGLQARFDANGLDSGPVKKAAQALGKLAEEVQAVQDAQIQAKVDYRQSVGPVGVPDLDALRRENEELKKRLAAR